jgi:hypothetical protein
MVPDENVIECHLQLETALQRDIQPRGKQANQENFLRKHYSINI